MSVFANYKRKLLYIILLNFIPYDILLFTVRENLYWNDNTMLQAYFMFPLLIVFIPLIILSVPTLIFLHRTHFFY